MKSTGAWKANYHFLQSGKYLYIRMMVQYHDMCIKYAACYIENKNAYTHIPFVNHTHTQCTFVNHYCGWSGGASGGAYKWVLSTQQASKLLEHYISISAIICIHIKSIHIIEYTHTCTHTYAHTHTHTRAHIHAHTYSYTVTHMHIHKLYTCTHTHAHMHTQKLIHFIHIHKYDILRMIRSY